MHNLELLIIAFYHVSCCLFKTKAIVHCPLNADMDRVKYSVRSDDGVLHSEFTGFGGRRLIMGVVVVKCFINEMSDLFSMKKAVMFLNY